MRWIILLCLFALPATAEPWIKYGRSGGVAGLYMNLRISSQGEVHYQDKKTPMQTWTLSEDEMEELRQTIPQPFPSEQFDSKTPRPIVPDGINSALEVGQDRIEWGTGTPTPHELYPLLEQLEKIRSRFLD